MPLQTSRDDVAPDHVLTLRGPVGADDGPELAAALLTALDPEAGTGANDVILDGAGATSFDAAALTGLVAARTRAKASRRRIVVVDHGAVQARLLSSGLHSRFPVFASVELAQQGLVELRRPKGLLGVATHATGTPR